mgnify:CR=1 FL=1
MPETEQSATDFVIDGDTPLLAARNEVAAAEASDDGMRMAEAYMALNDAGEHDAEARHARQATEALWQAHKVMHAWLHSLKLKDALSVFDGVIARDAKKFVAEQSESFGIVRGDPLFPPCPIFP